MNNRAGALAASAIVIAALASCGGGGGGGSAPAAAVATPSPTPTASTVVVPVPAPSPVPTTGIVLNARVGLHQQAEFPSYGWFYRGTEAGPPDGSTPVAVGYDAARNLTVMTIPGYARGGLIEFASETGDDISYALIDPTFGTAGFFNRGFIAQLLVPGLQNRIFPLESTGVGFWHWGGIAVAPADKLIGAITYGVPTAGAAVPRTGSATYALHGYTLNRPIGASGDPEIRRMTGTVTVDFTTGGLTGSFAEAPSYLGPVAGRAIAGRFTFVGGVTGGDGAFQATLGIPDESSTPLQGRFTGPDARELMLQWRGYFRDPTSGRAEMAYGVLAGRRS